MCPDRKRRVKEEGLKVVRSPVSSFACCLAFIQHRNVDAFLNRSLNGLFITCVNVARDTKTGIVCQHSIKSARCFICPVCDRDLSCVQRVTYADASAMMKRDPACAARCVQKRVQDRPVCDCIRAVLHSFSLSKRRRDAYSIKMIAANHYV